MGGPVSYTHMRLVAQNAPYIVQGGPVTRLDLQVLYIIAWHISDKDPDNSRWITNDQLKRELRMKPSTYDDNIARSIKRMVDLGLITFKAGTGKKANNYTLTRKIMEPGLSENGESPAAPEPVKAKKPKAEKSRRLDISPAPAKKSKKVKYQTKKRAESQARKEADSDAPQTFATMSSEDRVQAVVDDVATAIERATLTDEERDAVTLATRFVPVTKLTREQAEKRRDDDRRRKRALFVLHLYFTLIGG